MWIRAAVVFFAFQTCYFVTLSILGSHPLKDKTLLLFNLLFGLWLIIESAQVRLGHARGSRTFGTLSRLFLLTSLLSLGLGIYDRATHFQSLAYALPEELIVLGLLLMISGIYLRHISIKALGRFFVTKIQITDNHELIDEGIYGILRHPSYTGLILAFVGTLLMLGSTLALAFFVLVAVPTYIYRIWVEEKALVQSFGQKYLRYRSNTYALFPFLY